MSCVTETCLAVEGFSTTSSQAAENAEIPTIEATIPIVPTDTLELSPNGLCRFISPYQSIQYEVTFGQDDIKQMHLSETHPTVQWAWILCCMVERSGLLAGRDATKSGIRAISDAFNGVICLGKNLARDNVNSLRALFTYVIAIAKLLGELATPLRRSGVLSHLRALEGGRDTAEPVMVFGLMTDILRRECAVYLSEIADETFDCDFANLDDKQNHLFDTYNVHHLALTNYERLVSGKTTRIYPNDRNDVLKFYQSHDTLEPHVVATTKPRVSFSAAHGDAVNTSCARWEDLEEIDLGGMRCHKRHDGKYLICRVMTRPSVGPHIAVLTPKAVEDKAGRAIALGIENLFTGFCYKIPYDSLKQLYPVGSILAIKEPYVCLGKSTGVAEIRVTSPLDIAFRPAYDQTLFRYKSPTPLPDKVNASAYKVKGNAAIKLGDYAAAEKCYTLGISCLTVGEKELELALRLNRSLANINLKRYAAALDDCLTVEETFSDPMPEFQTHKLVYRKLVAAYGYGVWSTAAKAIEQCRLAGLDGSKWEPYRDKLKIREQEQQGRYNFSDLASSDKTDEYHADFMGDIEIREIKGKGRGMFAAKDLKAGQLLLAERNIVNFTTERSCSTLYHDVSKPKNLTRIDTGTAIAMIHEMIADPSLVRRCNSLHPDPTSSSLLLTEAEKLEILKSPLESFNIDDLSLKVNRNAFGGSSRTESKMTIYATSSLVNHSCLPNVAKMTVGHYSALWAAVDLKAGSELFLSYVDPNRYLESRTYSFTYVWQFKCECQSCVDDAKEDDAKRERMMKEDWPKVQADWEKRSSEMDSEQPITARRYHIVEMDAMMKRTIRVNQPLADFCEAIDETYRKDRVSPKNCLIDMYVKHQDSFGPGFPKGCLSPADGYKILLKLQGCEFSTPAEAKKTGRAISKLPYNARAQQTIKPMLKLAFFLRLERRTDEAAQWSRAAYWAMRAVDLVSVEIHGTGAMSRKFPIEQYLINGAVWV